MSHPRLTAQRDQVNAATRDQERVQLLVADYMGAERQVVPPSPRLRARMFRLLADMDQDVVRPCPHLAHPRPAFTFLWLDRVVCGACLGAWDLPPLEGDPDRTCDLCGHVCSGPPGDPIYPSSVQCGPILVFYGGCQRCMDELSPKSSS